MSLLNLCEFWRVYDEIINDNMSDPTVARLLYRKEPNKEVMARQPYTIPKPGKYIIACNAQGAVCIENDIKNLFRGYNAELKEKHPKSKPASPRLRIDPARGNVRLSIDTAISTRSSKNYELVKAVLKNREAALREEVKISKESLLRAKDAKTKNWFKVHIETIEERLSFFPDNYKAMDEFHAAHPNAIYCTRAVTGDSYRMTYFSTKQNRRVQCHISEGVLLVEDDHISDADRITLTISQNDRKHRADTFASKNPVKFKEGIWGIPNQID